MELIGREELARDARLMDIMRSAQHADKRGYSDYIKKMREHGR